MIEPGENQTKQIPYTLPCSFLQQLFLAERYGRSADEN
jgi:hypothetical protein